MAELTLVPDDLEIDVTIRGLAEGQRVFGRYTLKQILGRGGMGVVWLGHDGRLEREVALKFLPEMVFFDPSALEELKQETRRCLELTHPNIIRIYDFLHDKQAAAISMEYLDGKTLAALRLEKPQRVFEVDELKNWMLKVCQGLHYAHDEVGVVHRDLKPANLMVTSRGQIKIADFGISQSLCESMSRRTIRRGTSGTLAYMSPQQMIGDRSRATDDVYALGATIYEFLTSKPPFYRGDMSHQVQLVVPPSMAERRAELEISGEAIPQEWEEAIAACLAKVPEQRPKSTMELAERLGLSTMTISKPEGFAPAGATFVNAEVGKKIQPPPLPRRPFPTRRVLQASGLAIVLAMAGWPLWHFVLWPYFATPGEVRVTTNPPAATVHLLGKTDQTTPAVFSALRIGPYQMTISAEGFDPVEEAVTITPGVKIDLGTIQLKRAFGKLSLITLPRHAHYALAGSANTGNFQKEGSTPDFLPELPSGRYQLTLTEGRSPSYTETILVPAHGTKMEKADLIQLALAAEAGADAAKAFRGETGTGQLDENSRGELLALYNKAFEAYLSADLLAQAADQLAHLKDMGLETDAQQQELAAKRSLLEKETVGQLRELMSSGKFATAAEKFKDFSEVLEKESADRLDAEFQAPLAQYQAQIDAAIKTSLSGAPGAGYAQLKALSGQHPDDLHLQLALGEVQTRMAPNRERLAAQLRAFAQFGSENKDFADEPAFLEMQAVFARELRELDALGDAATAAKEGPAGMRNHLASLESRKEILEQRRVGSSKSNPFTQTLNFFGKAMTGHAVVNTGHYFSSQTEKREAIASVQAEIESQKQLLAQPVTTVSDAQKNYDEFVARVPWGQE